MSNLEALTAMGIKNPGEIARYELYDIDRQDVLRIVYNRKKGSILPITKKFKFPQVKKSTMVDSGSRQTQVLFESSGELRKAVAELDELLAAKKSTVDHDKLIAEELRHLEEEFISRVNYIKSLLDKD
jgi:hypothetical protein